jgi:cytochrome c oxidase subunit 3
MRIEEQTASVAGLPAEPEKATLEGKNKILGFWLFLGAETTLFATMFGTYLALKGETMTGPTTKELFHMPLVAVATFLLLTSSLTSVFAIMAMHQQDTEKMIRWFVVTILLGIAFLAVEIYEFIEYVHLDHTLTSSAFGSSFYLLLGTHGSHVLYGVCWITGLIIQARRKGLTVHNAPKFYVASLYWHFVDVVWVFIFTVVYLMGMMA